MAEVYKAHPAGHEERVLAIKKILPQFAKNKQLVGMLINEAKVTFGLEHPNIVPVIDFGMIEGTYFIAMEYIYGKDLKTIFLQLITRKKDLPIPIAVHVVSSVLKGLDYAHHKRNQFGQPLQIVHRDISPQNIVMSFSGKVKILDFGIAISTTKFDPTELGILKGKFSYMSPEQAYGREVDPRSDIYSAGIVLWELLTMESCFNGTSEVEVLNNVREPSVKSPSSVNSEVTSELSKIVMKALEKKVQHRYPTAGEFAQKLDQYLIDRYGPVTTSDISAFLRSIFNVDPSELQQDPVFVKTHSKDDTIDDLSPSGLSDILYPEEEAEPVPYVPPDQSAPWIKKTPSLFSSFFSWDLLLIPVSIFMIGFILTSVPIEKYWLKAKFLVMKAFEQTEAPSDQPIDIKFVPTPNQLYGIQFSNEAQSHLENLPFEVFEAIRNEVLDLANAPRPSHSRLYNRKNGDFIITVQDRDIIYEIQENRKTILIKNIF